MRTTYRIERRSAIKGIAALTLISVPTVRRALALPLDRFTLQTNWRAQAEHGGYYQALAAGIYRRYGIDCVIQSGGPNLYPAQMLLGGRADVCISNAFQALRYVRQDLPFLCVAGMCQQPATILMAHQGVGNDSFEQLRGKPILLTRGNGGGSDRDNLWGYLCARFGYTDDQLRPYTASLAPFMVDKNVVQQANLGAEPYQVRKSGVEPRILKFADIGLEGYSAGLDSSLKMVTERPDLLQRFLDASIEGWMQYIKGDDIGGAHALIKRDNTDMTDGELDYSRQTWIDNGIVFSGEALRLGIGTMNDEHWEHFSKIIADLGKYPPNFDFRRAYTLQFVNKRVGLT